MFGERLKELRKSSNISQEKIGEYLGVTSNAVYSWETGKSQPSIETITKIADYFGVTTDFLLGYDKNYSNDLERLRTLLNNNNLLNPDGTVKEEVNIAIEQAKRIKELYDRKGE